MVELTSLEFLPETPQWEEELPRLEDGMFPTGGPVDPENDSGLMNWQAQILGNRTAYLRKRMDDAGVATGISVTVDNLNTITLGGIYYIAAGGIGAPLATSAFIAEHMPGGSAAEATQVAWAVGTQAAYWRRKTAGAWYPWERLATGSVSSLLLDLSGLVNVAHYGAKGDGVTDDTVAIQSALDTGKHVIFPANEYRITAPLTVGNQKLIGRGTIATRAMTRMIVAGNHPCFINPTDDWNSFEADGFMIDFGNDTPVAAAGNDQKIGFRFLNAPIPGGGGAIGWPEQIRIANCVVRGAWYGFFDNTGTYMATLERVEARNCKIGFRKTNGTTFAFINCFVRGDGVLSEMGFWVSNVLAASFVACAGDGLKPGVLAYAGAANMFEGCPGLSINGWDAESNVIGKSMTYMRFTSGSASVAGFVGYQNNLSHGVDEETWFILNDACKLTFSGHTAMTPADLAYEGNGGNPTTLLTINGGETLLTGAVLTAPTGGTPYVSWATRIGEEGGKILFTASEISGTAHGAEPLLTLSQLVALPMGEIGTTGMFLNTTTSIIAEGDIVAGSTLIWCAADGGITGVDTPEGSWMCLGTCAANGATATPQAKCVSLFKRVL